MNKNNSDVSVINPHPEGTDIQCSSTKFNNQNDKKEVPPSIACRAGGSSSLKLRLQRCETPIAACIEDSLPRRQGIKLIDYTQNRNPRYKSETSFERTQVRPKDAFATNRSDRCDRATALLERKSSSIPVRQSIDTGSYLFEKRTHSSEERIEFMFKVPKQQARRSSREDLLATLQPRSSIPRQREHLARMFNSIPNRVTRQQVPKRNHSAPDCLQTKPDPPS